MNDWNIAVPDDPVNAFVPHSPPAIKGAETGPLAGLKFAVKDLYDIENYPTGGGSPEWLATHDPARHTSPLVSRLLDAGADMIGKTVCDELFYSFTGANAHYGTPKNIRAPGRMPGGSSSGSAAATAAGLCDFALGSDTGGSIRVPASFCGIFGLRPTHGRLDLAHAMAMAPSFDAAGWFANEAGILRRAGEILLDGRKISQPLDRVLVGEFAFRHADPAVANSLLAFLEQAAAVLPRIEPLTSAPDDLDLDQARECFRIIQAFETWKTFGDWIGETKPNFGPGIKERFEAAKTVTASDRDQAIPYRDKVRGTLRGMLEPGTLMVLPTAASASPLLDAPGDELEDFRRKTMALICLSSLAGLPQISIPAASSPEGFPVGLSVMGWAGGDEALLDLASALEPHCQKY
ncbi:MAG: amidase [Rhodospirillales bacterium]|mgnify:CR=1 FL=1|nr:amidase [Rhodospirillales bacterium]MDP6843611.1 amidase [Rhodospirillales bacterium]